MAGWNTKSLFAAMLLGVLASCSPPNDTAKTPKVLRVGILPDQTPEGLRGRYAGLFKHIKDYTGASVELVVPRSYDDLLRLFRNRKIDMAYFGGVTFVKAYRESRAVPLVMRDVDSRFHAYFLVRQNSPARSIRDLKGLTFCFGARLSTSGHLMPRHFLREGGIEPEKFFGKIEYSGAHDLTARWVRDGKVDAGVVNAEIADQMFRDGRLSPSDVRILWETPPFPDYVWAVQPYLSRSFRDRLREAFLLLSTDNADHARILRSVGATSFLPARPSDFSQLIAVLDSVKGDS